MELAKKDCSERIEELKAAKAMLPEFEYHCRKENILRTLTSFIPSARTTKLVIMDGNGNITASPREMAEALRSHWSNTFTSDQLPTKRSLMSGSRGAGTDSRMSSVQTPRDGSSLKIMWRMQSDTPTTLPLGRAGCHIWPGDVLAAWRWWSSMPRQASCRRITSLYRNCRETSTQVFCAACPRNHRGMIQLRVTTLNRRQLDLSRWSILTTG